MGEVMPRLEYFWYLAVGGRTKTTRVNDGFGAAFAASMPRTMPSFIGWNFIPQAIYTVLKRISVLIVLPSWKTFGHLAEDL